MSDSSLCCPIIDSHTLLGAEYPYALTAAERMDDATQAGLDADTLDQVLYRTAAGLLHLDQRPLSHG